MFYKSFYESKLGKITLLSDGKSLNALCLPEHRYFDDKLLVEAIPNDDLPIFVQTKNWLSDYFYGKKPNINHLSLAPEGNAFRQQVWGILQQIPYGKTMTYGEVAKRLNKGKMSAQAVGNAIGHNPIAIIIPCHRVIGKDGNLRGYAGGIDCKIKLLQLEGIDVDNLFLPLKNF